jgi:hypothetical protein
VVRHPLSRVVLQRLFADCLVQHHLRCMRSHVPLPRGTRSVPLQLATYHLLDGYGLVDKFKLSKHRLLAFSRRIMEGYRANPYHNSLHALDVLLNTNYFIRQPVVAGLITPLDQLAVLLSAVLHDFQHPGLTNAYLQVRGWIIGPQGVQLRGAGEVARWRGGRQFCVRARGWPMRPLISVSPPVGRRRPSTSTRSPTTTIRFWRAIMWLRHGGCCCRTTATSSKR